MIDKELHTATGDLTVDMTYYGFVVNSQNQIGGGGSCSTSGCSTSGCSGGTCSC
ncbi:MAG: hypothetical protein JW718_05850 [Desulfovibrionaceae bacterium]|nr:hypothetical protein [Desulfovibrionaceae bacterium]